MATCGVASAIFEFLADPVRNSLELPHMTTGQRKSIKKLVEQQPELSCESYGFGAERQLYLFKTSAGGTKEVDRSRSASPGGDCSTAASEASSDSMMESATRGSHPFNNDLAFPAIQVRNTFVHYGDSYPCDEEATKSMPHNMFSQCLKAEAAQRPRPVHRRHATAAPTPDRELEAPAPAAEAQPAQVEVGQKAQLFPGALVRVHGLLKLPAFNGCSAIVQGWDAAAGRYDILMVSAAADGGGVQQAKIKEENLSLLI